jgi:hypothetical protein
MSPKAHIAVNSSAKIAIVANNFCTTHGKYTWMNTMYIRVIKGLTGRLRITKFVYTLKSHPWITGPIRQEKLAYLEMPLPTIVIWYVFG